MIAGFFPSFTAPRNTAAAGTVFGAFVPPHKLGRIKVATLRYVVGTTAHTLYFMFPLWLPARTTAAVAAGANPFILDCDPGRYSVNANSQYIFNGLNAGGDYGAPALHQSTLPTGLNRQVLGMPTPSVADNPVAANDYMAYQLSDGNWAFGLASSPSYDASTGRLTVTIGTVGTGGVKRGAPVYNFGIVGDTNPLTGQVHFNISSGAAASGTTPLALDNTGGPIIQAPRINSPMLFLSSNGTVAGVLEELSGMYAPH